ncbi:MAG: alpha/beta fold hydrolase [Ilumatobacteraceae bacterium]
MARPRPILLVHGAWHGAWCWATLQAELDRRGLPSYAVDLPGHGLSTLPLGDMHGDAARVATAIAAIDDEVVLVGHSYGGAVVTHAAGPAHTVSDRIAHLVYVAAFALDDGETVAGYLRSRPRIPVAVDEAVITGEDGTSRLDPVAARVALYGSCPPPAVDAAIARLGPQPVVAFRQPVAGSARATIGSTYVRCTLDQCVHIEHQHDMAARCEHAITLESDHFPLIAMPAAVADVLEPLATR